MNYGTIKNGIVELGYNGEGFCYKNLENFTKKEGICYIGEHGVNEDASVYVVADSDTYTYEDLVELCKEFKTKNEVEKNIETIVNFLFERLDWQTPSTIIDEFENFGTFEE